MGKTSIRRRGILFAAGGVLVAPTALLAQRRDRPARVVYVAGVQQMIGEIGAGLIERGWKPGYDLVLDERPAPADAAGYERLADEIVREGADVVVVAGVATRPIHVALKGRLPLAFSFSGDPVEAGLVKSLSHPGGTSSGVTMLALELVGKRIQLLREVLPKLRRVAVFANPSHPGERAEYRESARAAETLGVEVYYHQVREPADFEKAFQSVLRERVEAIDLFPDGLVIRQAKLIAEFCVRQKKPAISGWGIFAREGNLLSYGPNFGSAFRQTASFVDRILRGASPATLPVEYPTRLELVVNLKTAKAIGVAIPPSVLVRADEVIQ